MKNYIFSRLFEQHSHLFERRAFNAIFRAQQTIVASYLAVPFRHDTLSAFHFSTARVRGLLGFV